MSVKDLLEGEVKLINIGLREMTAGAEAVGAPFVDVDWRPPMEVEPKWIDVVEQHRAEIEAANKKALDILLEGQPHLIDLAPAREVIPGMEENLFLHAGPPVTWENMCGPLRGAIIGGLLYEGKATTPEEAEELAASGEIRFAPCHEHDTVGPMAGVVTPSMPVFVVENAAFGNRAFCTLNEGLGKVLRYGAFSEPVIEKLKWMETVLFPALKRAMAHLGRIDLKQIIAQALHMGDELHNRNRAATSLLYRQLAPAIVKTTDDPQVVAEVLEFIDGNDHFFLNLSMPACKATLDAARNIPHSSIVTVMARNGTEFGIQLSGTGGEWFTGAALVPEALFFPGYSIEDANPDIGDSAITETAGLGGFAIAAAPAIVQFVGGRVYDAVRYTLQMYEITAGENDTYQIPYFNFRGTPTGIDVVQVVEKNILPFIDTGVAHKEPGVGQIGAGVVSAPAEPFRKAFEALAERLEKETDNKAGSKKKKG
ncbi:MAG: DUF1116 domain-containing protein [Calditrichaeota bacterium]|nr:MAG: DUF1116 domain-containing protein [Calditrichota bacterium]